jgi:hypothetical protein
LPPNKADHVARSVGRGIDRAEQHVDHLMRRAHAVEWRDQRLNDRRRAVDRAPVAPAFERMRERQMPFATHRGFVAE